MKRKLGGLLLAIGVALGLMAFRKQAAPPDLSTPQTAVRSFLTALRNQDVAAMQQCVQGKADEKVLKEAVETGATFPKCTVQSMLAEIEGNTAHVAVEYTVEATRPEDKELAGARMVDMFTLAKQGDAWHLTPDPNLKNGNGDRKQGYFPMMLATRPFSLAVALAGSEDVSKSFADSTSRSKAASCLSNVKQVALGVLMYVEDYDEMTPRKGVSYTELVYPYVKNRQVFTCPLSPKGTISYTFNSGVAGISLALIDEPAKTVMVYEGKDGKLDYKHDGEAAVGFMDGHTKLIKAEESAGLIWTVKVAKAPAKPTKPTKKKGRK